MDIGMIVCGAILIATACTIKLRTDGEIVVRHVIEIVLDDGGTDASDAGEAE